MPTRDNIIRLESLIDATTLLLETKKNVDRVEQDIRVMKAQLMRMRNEQLGGEEGGVTPMDVDQEAVADDDDTGIHPGRGARKKNVGVSVPQSERRVRTNTDSSAHRQGGPCQYLPPIPPLNPGGPIRGRNRAELLP